MTLGPSRPLRPFTVGYRWTKSCKPVTGKLNTFTNFYLKDLTWLDNDNNMYLGPVVAAQVLDPSPQTSHPRKDRRGGHIRYSQVFRSLISGSRYRFTSQDVTGKVIFSLSSIICIKDLSRLSLISCSVAKMVSL